MVALVSLALPGVDAKNETEPVLSLPTEAGPRDGAAQREGLDNETGLLVDLTAHAGRDVLVGLQPATETVVVAEVDVIGSLVTVDHQNAMPVRREDIAQRGQDGLMHGHIVPAIMARVVLTHDDAA